MHDYVYVCEICILECVIACICMKYAYGSLCVYPHETSSCLELRVILVTQ